MSNALTAKVSQNKSDDYAFIPYSKKPKHYIISKKSFSILF